MQDAAFEIRTYADNQWHATAHTKIASKLQPWPNASHRRLHSACRLEKGRGYSLPLVYLAAWRINAAVAPSTGGPTKSSPTSSNASTPRLWSAKRRTPNGSDGSRRPARVTCCNEPATRSPRARLRALLLHERQHRKPAGCLVRRPTATHARARNRVDGVDNTSVLLLARTRSTRRSPRRAMRFVASVLVRRAAAKGLPRARRTLGRALHARDYDAAYLARASAAVPGLKSWRSAARPCHRSWSKLVAATSRSYVYGVTECCSPAAIVRTRRRLRPARGGAGGDDKPGGRRGCCVGRSSTARRTWAGRAAARSDGQGRYYRTGDGGALEDGAIRLQGRLDDQIKRSGRRTELALDAALEATALVAACRFVLVDDALWRAARRPRPDRRRSKPTPRWGRPGGGALPARPYVQPAAVFFAKTLPRTRTDKIDRRPARPRRRSRYAKAAAGTAANLHNDQRGPRRVLSGPRPARRRGYFLRGARRHEPAGRRGGVALGRRAGRRFELEHRRARAARRQSARAAARRRKWSGAAAAEARPHGDTAARVVAPAGRPASTRRWRFFGRRPQGPVASHGCYPCASTRAAGRRSGRQASH